ncbi:peptidoglycan DD-metalloendopeptidase family protein [Candidatus Chloroploca sp. Khr17]|uniref:peptidoglycan DD-metalloendopeptidase family protein n=1 Tax=Candidatus Chloroploca sp. Khr17 TaxID=2496869 RepID=UPI00101C7977|nr:peptidoglycan DD-metalloendopeptidase family protein [Candidatus Chloroploca sp. Khr17]
MPRSLSRTLIVFMLSLLVITLLATTGGLRAMPNPPRLLDDATFVIAPGFDHRAIQTFLERQAGSLATYQASLDGQPAPAAHVLAVASLGEAHALSPRVLLTLLELTTGLVRDPQPPPAVLEQPFGLTDPASASFEADLFAMGELLRRSFAAYDPAEAPILTLGTGQRYARPPLPNAATYALEHALARLAPDAATFERYLGEGPGSFRGTFAVLFDDSALLALAVEPLQTVAPFLTTPFSGSFRAGSFFDHHPSKGVFRRFDGTSTGGYDGHEGTDYPMSVGQTIIAAADGVVVDVAVDRQEAGVGQSWCIDYPYTPVTGMIIQHQVEGITYRTWYWHLESQGIATNPRTGQRFQLGDTIFRGEMVGRSGNTGCSTGPHLHFGVQRSGVATDPYGWCGAGSDPYPTSSQVLWSALASTPAPCAVAPPPATYSGEFVSQSFQPQMVAGSTQQVQLQLRNTGTGAWDANTKIFALPLDQNHPFYDPSWLGPYRIASPGVVQPGAMGVFQFTLRAPATPGSYRIEFGFVQEGSAWFSAPANGAVFFPITVTAASATLQNNSFEDPAGPAPWQWHGPCNMTTYESGVYGVTAFHGTHFLATNRGEQPECTSFYQDIPYVPTPGTTYTFALMIHAPPGTTRTGTLALWAMGGEQPNASRTFTVSQQGWMCHEVSLPIQQSGHTGLRAEVYFPNEAIGVDTLFDYALVQEGTASLCPTVGSGSSRPGVFAAAYERNRASATLGSPMTGAFWGGEANPVVMQWLTGAGDSRHAMIFHDEVRDQPAGSVPAYVLHGPLFTDYWQRGHVDTWLGAPTSDIFTNAQGQLQANFTHGYLVMEGRLDQPAQAYTWPTPAPEHWYVRYFNGMNRQAGPTWVEQVPDAQVARNWVFAAPGNGQVGVWDDGFSSEWTRTVTLVGGEYEFFAYGDDRVQVFLNDEPLMSAAYLEPSTLRRTLATGDYTFRLEHEEEEGGAQIEFTWTRLAARRVYLPVVRR